jgi:uncharacterized protein YndB with AHSA1/START domain
MTRSILAILMLAGCAAPARADVADVGPSGFSIAVKTEIAAAPAAVFALVGEHIGQWWDSSHTFSGSSANLRIEPRAGACWCEVLPGGGGVQHMIVSHVIPPKSLVMRGALGPLGTMGVTGAMEWTFVEKDGRTQVAVVYNVGGFTPGGFAPIAAAVDGVITSQVARLKKLAETGRPD